MKKLLKKITRYFKTDTELFIEELSVYLQVLDDTIKLLEQNVHIFKSAVAKHLALGHSLEEKIMSKQMRMESLNKIVIQYVEMGNYTAASDMIRERVKEQHKLQGLYEIVDLHNQRIQQYQDKLKKAVRALDNQKSNREAFIIKQQIAIQEMIISERLEGENCKKHIERIHREILGIDTSKSFDLKEDVIDDAQIDAEIEKELSFFRVNYSSNNL